MLAYDKAVQAGYWRVQGLALSCRTSGAGVTLALPAKADAVLVEARCGGHPAAHESAMSGCPEPRLALAGQPAQKAAPLLRA